MGSTQVILTEDVVGVGDIGEKISVKRGFARNYLIPRGFAIEAQSAKAKLVAHRMKQIEAKRKRLQADAEKRAESIRDLKLDFELRFAKGGRAFGSINSKDIAAKLAEQGFEIDRRRVQLSEPLKKAGAHLVKVKLHPEVFAHVKVQIEALQATAKQEREEAEETQKKLLAEQGEEATATEGESGDAAQADAEAQSEAAEEEST